MIADIVAEDAEGRDILLVDVEGMKLSPELAVRTFEMMETACPSVPFGMVVDPDEIRVVEFGRSDPSTIAAHFPTPEMLRLYDPELGSKRIHGHYLAALVEGWLRDLAYRWKSETPPGLDSMATVGLLQRLKGGTTRREVPFGTDDIY